MGKQLKIVKCRVPSCLKSRNGASTLCGMHNARRNGSSKVPFNDRPHRDKNRPSVWLSAWGYNVTHWEGKERRIARLCWEAYHGPIPKGYEIHHKEKPKTNDRIWNLECLTIAEHQERHRRMQHEANQNSQ